MFITAKFKVGDIVIPDDGLTGHSDSRGRVNEVFCSESEIVYYVIWDKYLQMTDYGTCCYDRDIVYWDFYDKIRDRMGKNK